MRPGQKATTEEVLADYAVTGSIHETANRLGIDYRAAWAHIKKHQMAESENIAHLHNEIRELRKEEKKQRCCHRSA